MNLLTIPFAKPLLPGFLVFVSVVSSGVLIAQGEPKAMRPAKLQPLLKVLPESAEGWKLEKSVAYHDYDEWLHGVATRVFTRERPESKPGPTMKTTITVTDTGGYAPTLSLYADFAPTAGEGFEKKYLETFPAVIIQYGSQKRSTEMLVDKRFLVKIVTENQPEKFIKQWIKQINFRELSRIKDGPIVPLPEMVRIRQIDELVKENNRSYDLATASGARIDAEVTVDAVATNNED